MSKIQLSRTQRSIRFATGLLLILTMSALDFGPAVAGLAPSRSSGVTAISSSRDADLRVAQRALENKVVGQKLLDYGVNPQDAQARLASMSDQDLHTLATAAKGLPIGGDGAGALIGVLIVVILVIVILRLMNREVIVR